MHLVTHARLVAGGEEILRFAAICGRVIQRLNDQLVPSAFDTRP